MNKFDKAVVFYLRGFGSAYIKRRTGISMQSLLKQLLAKGIKYTKEDIVRYQIEYIKSKFSTDEIVEAYCDISKRYPNLEQARRGRHIECLGCGFGDYPKVFRALLGLDVYKSLVSKCWHIKQTEVVRNKYGVDNVFQKETFDFFVSQDAVERGRQKRLVTLIDRYGVESPNANPEIAEKMQSTLKSTMQERYNVDNPMQIKTVALRSAKSRQKTMRKKYGAPNSVQIDSVRNQIFESRKKNGTVSSSAPEDALYEMLILRFGCSNIVRNYVDERYPYHVDFYVKPLDLFIELNGDRCHNNHWYDKLTLSADTPSIESLVKGTASQRDLADLTSTVSDLSNYVDTIAGLEIDNNSGYFRWLLNANNSPIGLYVLVDSDELSEATKLYRWTNEGLKFSSTGVSGTFTDVLTNDGKIGEELFKSQLDPLIRLVKCGTSRVESSGYVYIYLDTDFYNELTNLGYTYTVFVQPLDGGTITSVTKNLSSFVVNGDAGVDFDWCIRARRTS